MASFKDPTFLRRIASARLAKDKAVAWLKAKPPTDPAVLAQRRATADARDAKLHEKRAAKEAAARTAAAEKVAMAEQAAAAEAKLASDRKPVATEEERKAARDARYAARKKARK